MWIDCSRPDVSVYDQRPNLNFFYFNYLQPHLLSIVDWRMSASRRMRGALCVKTHSGLCKDDLANRFDKNLRLIANIVCWCAAAAAAASVTYNSPGGRVLIRCASRSKSLFVSSFHPCRVSSSPGQRVSGWAVWKERTWLPCWGKPSRGEA